MKNAIIISSLLFFTSCTKMLMRANGFKTPRYESEERINSFAQTNQIDEGKIVFLNDTTEQKKMLKLFSNSPGIIIADSAWNRLNFQNKKENCAAPVENLLMNLCNIQPTNIYYTDSNLIAFRKSKAFYKAIQNKPSSAHYIFFLWNTSMGKNIKKIKAWENTLIKHANCDYQTFWINCDYMANWYSVKPGKKIRYKVDRK
ncbi:MAG: hypothetical protein RL516_65 [Bacteroidota bacterium]|jgi:hypothetical protein